MLFGEKMKMNSSSCEPALNASGRPQEAPPKERPILFSGPMVRALLAGRKTQTRRIAKLPKAWAAEFPICSPDQMAAPHEVWWHGEESVAVGVVQSCPYGQPGDRLWVREAYTAHWGSGGQGDGRRITSGLITQSDGSQIDVSTTLNDLWAWYAADNAELPFPHSKWRPSIHMPRWASRLTLEITEVRVERLQDISEADAIAEGLYKSYPDDEDREWFKGFYENDGQTPTAEEWAQFEDGVWMAPGAPQGWGLTPAERRKDTWGPTPQFCYRLIWEAINGKDSWTANPFVWVVSFGIVSARDDRRALRGDRTTPAGFQDEQPLDPELAADATRGDYPEMPE